MSKQDENPKEKRKPENKIENVSKTPYPDSLEDWSPFDIFEPDNQPAGKSKSVIKGVDNASINEGPEIKDLDPNKPETFPHSWARRHQDREASTHRSETGRTTTQKTQANYAYRATSLIERYRREKGMSDENEISYTEFANYLLGLSADIAPTTWRYYRNAVPA